MAKQNASIGILIAKWRKRVNLSQAALADKLGSQQATVSKLESGVYSLSVLHLLAILDACGLSLVDVAVELENSTQSASRPLWERINE